MGKRASKSSAGGKKSVVEQVKHPQLSMIRSDPMKFDVCNFHVHRNTWWWMPSCK